MNKAVLIVLVLGAIVAGVFIVQGGKGDVPTQSLEGIHIMADGTVMLGNGEMVEGAEVTPDGMIKLQNGEMVAPVMDLREGGSMEGMEMDAMEMSDTSMEGGNHNQ